VVLIKHIPMTKKEKEERTCRWMLTVPCRIIQAEKKNKKQSVKPSRIPTPKIIDLTRTPKEGCRLNLQHRSSAEILMKRLAGVNQRMDSTES
jgi:hypothetical protein